jgi:radical SAM domain protein
MISPPARFFSRQFRANEAKLHPLNYLFWECTWRCNLRCAHCGSDCHCASLIPDMPFADFIGAVRPIRQRYPRQHITVIITGGEPLLRSDLAHCGAHLREEGFRWGIVSNGLCYTPARHAELLGAGMGAITLSLDGLENTHNRFRANPDSYAHVVEALQLIASSPRLSYDVVTCVHPGNLEELPALLELLLRLGVRAWRIFTIAPIGRAAHRDDLQLDGRQLVRLMDFIERERTNRHLDLKFSCEAFLGSYEGRVRDGLFFCRAGINIASVLVNGDICACPNIHRSFAQGNIYRDSFVEVWEKRFTAMRNRSWMKTGECCQCPAWTDCQGGAMHLRLPHHQGPCACLYQRMLTD